MVTPTTQHFSLSLHDALPICRADERSRRSRLLELMFHELESTWALEIIRGDRKSTRLNSVTDVSRMPSSARKKNRGPVSGILKRHLGISPLLRKYEHPDR